MPQRGTVNGQKHRTTGIIAATAIGLAVLLVIVGAGRFSSPDVVETVVAIEVPSPPQVAVGRGQLELETVPSRNPENSLSSAQASRGIDHSPPGEPLLPTNMTLSTEAEMRGGELELIKGSQPVYYWVKNRSDIESRWRQTAEKRGVKDPSKVVRIACLYAGFVRDFENMFKTCNRDDHNKKLCNNRKYRKFYGNHRDYLLDTTDCDVYLSTWDIVGAGKYSTTSYAMHEMVSPKKVKGLYQQRIAGIHVQKYDLYQGAWRYMHKHRRFFPQMRPQRQYGGRAGEERWVGVHEDNDMLRLNDYSQSYKHWLVVQLALRSGFDYDLFYRLRLDLRMTSRLMNFKFLNPGSGDRSRIAFDVMQAEQDKEMEELAGGVKSAGKTGNTTSGAETVKKVLDDEEQVDKQLVIDEADTVEEVNITKRHHVNADRIHTSNFDIADFGFMGSPAMIERLTHVWWYCLQPPTATVTSIHGQAISEYNLMVWRIIFDAKWEVDSGGRYLWVSRRAGKKPNEVQVKIVRKIIKKTIRIRKRV